MPAAVAIAVRYLIMAAVQLGLWTLLEKYGIPLINGAIEAIMLAFGVPKDTAEDIMANKVLVAFEEVGIFAASLRTKMPLKVAEALGFTTKGWSKRTLSSAVASKVESTAISATTKAVATPDEVGIIAKTISAAKGLNGSLVSSLFNNILKVVAVTSGLFFAAAQYIDYANWQGPYQKTFQGILTALGFPAPTAQVSARSISDDAWKKIYTIVETLNPESIAFPWDDTVLPYSRTNLAKAVDHFAANIALTGANPTYANVWGLLLPCIKLKSGGTSTSAAASLPAAGAGASTYTPVKVFTGILSQGTLGAQQPFTSKEDDLINSSQELHDVAQTNAAAFLAALPGRISYEIKIVNNVIAADGSKRIGASIQVPNGTTKAGKPKYKFVTNKFAVMTLYYARAGATRTKLADVTLGPTDIAHFNPTPQQLVGIGNTLVQTVATNKTDDIAKIVTNTPTAVVPTSTQPAPLPNYNVSAKQPGDLGYAFYKRENGNGQPPTYVAVPDYKFWDPNFGRITEEEYRRGTGSTKDYTNSGYTLKDGVFMQASGYLPSDQAPSPAASTAATATAMAQEVAKATNLSEYYAALGQPLPSLSARGQTYQSYGLGAASLYTGTVEQNTKLLNKLQGF